MPKTVARLLADSLEAHDVDQVFCVPGESYIGLTSALIERNSIRVVVCRHEGGAGYMAVADGRLRDRAGVAVVSRGPGLSNAMVSLHSAYHDATPLVMLVGQVDAAISAGSLCRSRTTRASSPTSPNRSSRSTSRSRPRRRSPAPSTWRRAVPPAPSR